MIIRKCTMDDKTTGKIAENLHIKTLDAPLYRSHTGLEPFQAKRSAVRVQKPQIRALTSGVMA